MIFNVSFTKYYSGDQLEKNEMGWASSSGRDIHRLLNQIFKKWYRVEWTGFIWLRIGRGSGHL
jgi:hypothetical protein